MGCDVSRACGPASNAVCCSNMSDLERANLVNIHAAAKRGNISDIELVCQLSPDRVWEMRKDRSTPLHQAAAGGHVKAVKALLEAQAPIDATDKRGNTALDYARENKRHEIVAMLSEMLEREAPPTPPHSSPAGHTLGGECAVQTPEQAHNPDDDGGGVWVISDGGASGEQATVQPEEDETAVWVSPDLSGRASSSLSAKQHAAEAERIKKEAMDRAVAHATRATGSNTAAAMQDPVKAAAYSRAAAHAQQQRESREKVAVEHTEEVLPQRTEGATAVEAQSTEGATAVEAQSTEGATAVEAQSTEGATAVEAQSTEGATAVDAQRTEGATAQAPEPHTCSKACGNYSCEHCGRQMAARVRPNGRVREKCECGGPEQDSHLRMHSDWVCIQKLEHQQLVSGLASPTVDRPSPEAAARSAAEQETSIQVEAAFQKAQASAQAEDEAHGVTFSSVRVLEFNRVVGHTDPAEGNYPLGIGDVLVRENEFSVSEFEAASHREETPQPLSEEQRMAVLGVEAGATVLHTRTEAPQESSVCAAGCRCESQDCPCVKEGIQCYDGGGELRCGCAESSQCSNPQGVSVFNEEEVARARTAKLQELNGTDAAAEADNWSELDDEAFGSEDPSVGSSVVTAGDEPLSPRTASAVHNIVAGVVAHAAIDEEERVMSPTKANCDAACDVLESHLSEVRKTDDELRDLQEQMDRLNKKSIESTEPLNRKSIEPDYRAQVVAIFEEHEPRKLNKVDKLLETYSGREPQLLEILQQKYSDNQAAQGKQGPDHRAQLVALYEEHDPTKLNKVDKLLKNYSGREELLVDLIRKKYLPKPDECATDTESVATEESATAKPPSVNTETKSRSVAEQSTAQHQTKAVSTEAVSEQISEEAQPTSVRPRLSIPKPANGVSLKPANGAAPTLANGATTATGDGPLPANGAAPSTPALDDAMRESYEALGVRCSEETSIEDVLAAWDSLKDPTPEQAIALERLTDVSSPTWNVLANKASAKAELEEPVKDPPAQMYKALGVRCSRSTSTEEILAAWDAIEDPTPEQAEALEILTDQRRPLYDAGLLEAVCKSCHGRKTFPRQVPPYIEQQCTVCEGTGVEPHYRAKNSQQKVNQLLQDCLLYTSDAADEEDSVDLGGRGFIKKKKKG
eukprot:TRINITY_DN4531_c0_g1_i3.p1 TRINITY_DN4531_c0_g1~~TRINITY_DN4531_c0_g1_i3.p1  ORF type:complete len:1144 (-),score=270.61 TRINITY_DN4531_c0_g1_i3:40-3471(-)